MSNAERNAEIIRMRRIGCSYIKIASTMSLTKSVVAGVVFRAGLSDPLAKQHAGRGEQYTDAYREQCVRALDVDTWDNTAAKWGVSLNSISVWRRKMAGGLGR